MSTSIPKFHYIENHLRVDIDNIEEKIKEDFPLLDPNRTVILAPIRGGLIPSTWLSHRLELPLKTCQFQRYDGNDGKPLLYGIPSDVCNIIVVDDICDKGVTMECIKTELEARFPNCGIGYYTLVAPQGGGMDYVYSARIVPAGYWTHFYWEKY